MASIPTSTDEWLELKPVRVMCDALDQGRLSHSLILSGEDPVFLEPAARFVASRILAAASSETALENHPDFLTLRPTGKMRQISADNTRELIRNIFHSPQAGNRKVALVFEAERMHLSAANIFLKTLEEPPGNTTIILLTNRPGFLLPTIRSRCLHFRLPRTDSMYAVPEPAETWLNLYGEWLTSLTRLNLRDPAAISGAVMTLYGLLARFSGLLKELVAEAWGEQKEKQTGHLSDEELDALEEGVKRGIRDRLFAAIERRTREIATGFLADDTLDSNQAVKAFSAAVGEIERSGKLLRVNLNEATALEAFLLSSLRIWTRLRT